MAYEARRDGGYDPDDRDAQRERANQNNANNIRNAADVAIATKNPYAVAAGAAVKAADKITGGKSTEALGKGMTRANEMTPGGKRIQDASNQLNESGASDKIGQAAAMKNQFSGGGEGAASAADGAAKTGTATEGMERKPLVSGDGPAVDANESGGGPKGSLPSSRDKDDEDKSDSDTKTDGLGGFLGKQLLVAVAFSLAPVVFLILLIVVLVSSITGGFTDYEDAFGMSSTLGQETGGVEFTASSKEQEDFYNRINDVKLSFQSQGKSVDAMKIVSIYHALKANDVAIEYKDVTTDVITNWANAMFNGNEYSDDTFRDNLIHTIFPQYKPGLSEDSYKEMADEVFNYLDRYGELVGTKGNNNNSCASIGTCSYDIKGFSINGRNVVKNMQIDNLKVRLMECGSPYGNGNYTTPIDQDLVSFEDYAAGVAYAEVGPSANEEVLKAQMVAARSFALARPTAMGNGHGKKLEQENGQWILQISSCVADQVFCNIDQGCSYMGGGDGQGGICRSGKVAGAQKTREALPANHAIRRAAAATQGEVLVNSQGYIISTGYKSTDQNNWAALAKSGLNYKQILLQSYNSGSRNYGATDVKKMSCGGSGSSSGCVSSGEFSTWKQGASEWGSIPMGNSGKTISQIGCLVTSVSMLVAKSGVPTNVNPWNPGTFVQFLNQNGGFASGGNFVWASVTKAAPTFKYAGSASLAGLSRDEKLNRISSIISQQGVYAVCEVKGNTGQHWVAIDAVEGSTIRMMDPSTNSTDMWGQYNWANTSRIAYFKVG